MTLSFALPLSLSLSFSMCFYSKNDDIISLLHFSFVRMSVIVCFFFCFFSVSFFRLNDFTCSFAFSCDHHPNAIKTQLTKTKNTIEISCACSFSKLNYSVTIIAKKVYLIYKHITRTEYAGYRSPLTIINPYIVVCVCAFARSLSLQQ